MENSNVSLKISKDIVRPIVEAKIQEAVIEALGGKDEIITGVVKNIINSKVDANGKPSTYNNAKPWIDFVLTQKIQEAVKDAVKEEIEKASSQIKAELVRQLKTKKGSNIVASALLSGLTGTFSKSYRSSINIELSPRPIE